MIETNLVVATGYDECMAMARRYQEGEKVSGGVHGFLEVRAALNGRIRRWGAGLAGGREGEVRKA